MRFLKQSRESFLDAHSDANDWVARFFSGATYSLWKVSRDAMVSYCRGLVLDAGAGRGGWRSTILTTAADYESIDMSPRGEHQPTWIGDLCSMPHVPSARFDTVVCHQVLEHVRRPWLAVAEMQRVLAPDGMLILTVPHLSRRHELPHDYFRYTPEGVAALLQEAGLELVRIRLYGGVLAFLHHQFSFIVPGMLAGIPVIGMLGSMLNAPVSWLVVQFDRVLDPAGLMPTGVLAIARKPGGSADALSCEASVANGWPA